MWEAHARCLQPVTICAADTLTITTTPAAAAACRGFTPFAEETLDPQHSKQGDTHEGLYFGREVQAGSEEAALPLHGVNQWPADVSHTWHAHTYAAMRLEHAPKRGSLTSSTFGHACCRSWCQATVPSRSNTLLPWSSWASVCCAC